MSINFIDLKNFGTENSESLGVIVRSRSRLQSQSIQRPALISYSHILSLVVIGLFSIESSTVRIIFSQIHQPLEPSETSAVSLVNSLSCQSFDRQSSASPKACVCVSSVSNVWSLQCLCRQSRRVGVGVVGGRRWISLWTVLQYVLSS